MAGCGSDGDDEGSSTAETPAGATPETSESPATDGDRNEPALTEEEPGPSKRTTPEKSPSKGEKPSGGTGSTPESRQVERYLRDNFGGAKSDWYDSVVEIGVSRETTTIKTDLPDDRAGKRQARQICLNVRGSIPGLTDTVRVTELGGSTLAKCVP